MVSDMAYKIIKRAITLRAQADEDSVENLLAIYTKLSDEQAKQMLEELKDNDVLGKKE